MNIDTRIAEWLKTVEGPCTCIGYIPCRTKTGTGNFKGLAGQNKDDYTPMGVSGVTVGVGVDLGQQTAAQLRKWGVEETLIKKLAPYIGKQGRKAIEALASKPLTLSQAEAESITRAEQAGYLNDVVVPWFNAYCGYSGAFEQLPWQAQAVIFSLVYQCGTKGALRRGPNTILAISEHEWGKATACLCDVTGWQGEYVSRRRKEGGLLKTISEGPVA